MRRFAAVSFCAVVVGGCNDVGRALPEDRVVFPTGVAVDAAGEHLIVVSSDFDFAFDSGAVLVADLEQARKKLGSPDDIDVNPWASPVEIPPLGDRPVITADGTVFVVTRGENLLHELRLDGGDLSCGDGGESCVLPPHVLQLGANDPDRVLLFGADESGPPTAKRGLITHLSSPQAEIFNFDPAEDGAGRLSVESDVVFFGEDVVGVKSAVVRSTPDEQQVFLTLQKTFDGTAITSFTELGVFSVPGAGRGDTVEVESINLTAQTGSLFARAIVVVDDGSDGVAVIVALRGPDALARYAYDDRTGTFSLTHLSESCLEPTELAVVDAGAGGFTRVLVTCQRGEVVQGLDALTLDVQDSVRFFGANPYGLAVDPVHNEAFVTFFLDDSVGVLGLVDDDGNPALLPRGHLGNPLPPREDGRE